MPKKGFFRRILSFVRNIGTDNEEKAKSERLLQRIEADLKEAARIQRDLLPKEDPRLEGYDPGRMAARLSEFVLKSTGPASFVAFFFGELDRRTGDLRYINAGHNPPFLLDEAGHGRDLGSSGFPLGMFPGAAYEVGTVRLGSGELAILFTDGVTEGRNTRGEEYGGARLEDLVRQSRALPATRLCRKVIEDVRDFSSETEPCDDMTIVVVKRAEAVPS